MKILDSLRGRTASAPADTPGSGPTEGGDLPIDHYDSQSPAKINRHLPGLSQVELTAIDEHERANEARPEVLHMLRYMRQSEPVEGYDAMEASDVKEMLPGANARTVRAVRDYERKFRNRPDVRAEAARVLPNSAASPEDTEAREAKTARIQESGRRS